jgi:hypothetical protein
MGFTSANRGHKLRACAPGEFAIHPRDCTPAQQDQTMTATASAPTKSDACTAFMDKAYGLCMARGFFNITGVNCDCNQRNVPGAPWECVGNATCKK